MPSTLTKALALAAAGLIAGAADSWRRPVQLRVNVPVGTAPVPKDGSGVSGAKTVEQPHAAPGGATAVRDPRLDDGVHIDVAEAHRLYEQGVPFLDARTEKEYVESHITGALLLNVDSFSAPTAPRALAVLAPDQPVVIYCGGGSCDASEAVAIRLQQAGFTSLRIFLDGFPAWQAGSLPVESGPDPLAAEGTGS